MGHACFGLGANLECRSEICCMRLAEIQDAKIRHLHTIAQHCPAISLQLKHVSTIGENLLNSSISSTCPQNMVNFGPLMTETGTPFNHLCLCYDSNYTRIANNM